MILYCPEPSVVTVRDFSISTSLAASTLTPGSTAPDRKNGFLQMRHAVMSGSWRRILSAGLFLAGAAQFPLSAQPTQPIYLQYDGFVKNTDGTLTVSFGYFNMNNVDVTVAPGAAN